MTVSEISEATAISERHIKRILVDHPKMFVVVSGSDSGGRGNPKRWGRLATETRLWYQDRDVSEEEELPW